LTKALGVGVYSAALKKEALSVEAYDEMLASTTLLNRIGTRLAQDSAVHAVTDVTGFGLLGHALEIACGSGVTVRLEANHVPLFQHAETLVRQGFIIGSGSARIGDRTGRLPSDGPNRLHRAWRAKGKSGSGGLTITLAPAATPQRKDRHVDNIVIGPLSNT
jgi:selenide,water dikinase